MSVALFAMIGAMLNAKTAYWIIFGFYCAAWLFGKVKITIKK